jgi:hypothetical protein
MHLHAAAGSSALGERESEGERSEKRWRVRERRADPSVTSMPPDPVKLAMPEEIHACTHLVGSSRAKASLCATIVSRGWICPRWEREG